MHGGLNREVELMIPLFYVNPLPVSNLSRHQPSRQRRLNFFLNRSLQRPGTVSRIVTDSNQVLPRGVGQRDLDMSFRQARSESVQLDFDDLLQFVFSQTVERDDLVHAIQEFRPEQNR